MTYLLKNNQKKKTAWWPWVVFCTLALLLYFFATPLRVAFYTVLRPVFFAHTAVGNRFTSFFAYMTSKKSLVAENENLKSQLAVFELQKTEYDLLRKENQTLKESFGRRTNQDMVLGIVLSKPPISPYDTFALDVGLRDGVALGAVVYTPLGGAIGTISEVASTKSFVSLFSNSETETELSSVRTGINVRVRGQGGGTMRVDVPKDADLVWGDVFVLPHIESSIVGSVFYVDTESQNSFKSLYIRFPNNIWSTQYVLVEKIL